MLESEHRRPYMSPSSLTSDHCSWFRVGRVCRNHPCRKRTLSVDISYRVNARFTSSSETARKSTRWCASPSSAGYLDASGAGSPEKESAAQTTRSSCAQRSSSARIKTVAPPRHTPVSIRSPRTSSAMTDSMQCCRLSSRARPTIVDPFAGQSRPMRRSLRPSSGTTSNLTRPVSDSGTAREVVGAVRSRRLCLRSSMYRAAISVLPGATWFIVRRMTGPDCRGSLRRLAGACGSSFRRYLGVAFRCAG